MKTKYFLTEEIKAYVGIDGFARYPFIISTNTVDRDGDIIDFSTIDIENFKKNPVMLWNHERYGNLPIGKWENIRIIDGNKLYAEALFHGLPNTDETELSSIIEQYVANGYLKTASIGFRVKNYISLQVINSVATMPDGKQIEVPEGFNHITLLKNVEILEASIVDIPANPEAEALKINKSIDDIIIKNQLEKQGRELSNANIQKISIFIDKLISIKIAIDEIVNIMESMIQNDEQDNIESEVTKTLNKTELIELFSNNVNISAINKKEIKYILEN